MKHVNFTSHIMKIKYFGYECYILEMNINTLLFKNYILTNYILCCLLAYFGEAPRVFFRTFI